MTAGLLQSLLFFSMNRKYILCCGLLWILFFPVRVGATHAAGSELIYEWLRDSTYRFYFKFFNDCSGNISAYPDYRMCYFSPCDSTFGQVTMLRMSLLANNQLNGQAVSTGCPGVLTKCDHPSATFPGFEEWWYMADVTLPSRCDNWTFYLSINARNASDNLTGLTTNLYTEATLNNKDEQRFSSPYFSVKPIPYICINEPIGYSGGPVDPDGDVLTYEFITPRTQGGGLGAVCTYRYTATPVNFITPYDLTNPFATSGIFLFDPATSLMNFTPSLLSKNGIAVRVNKFRNGIKLGSVMRDVQFQVINCNTAPIRLEVIPTTVTGARYVNGRIEACAGVPFRFCYKATTSLGGTLLVASDNHATALPGSVATYANQATDSVLTCISWSSVDTGIRLLTVTVKDSTCRSPGVIVPQTFIIPVYVRPVMVSYLEVPLCLGDTVALAANGSTNVQWSVLPGGSDISSLSCTNCVNPVARPVTTTTYIARYNTSNTCGTGDTVVVQVTENAIEITPAGPLAFCTPDSLSLEAQASGPRPTITLDCGITQGSVSVATDTVDLRLLVPGGPQVQPNPASTPFNGNHTTARHQYLIRASDLVYSGMRSGTLTSISFYISAPASAALFEQLSISLKCTADPLDAAAGFQPGAIPVYTATGPVTLPGTTGWVDFEFDVPYDWDGIQDILVEVCYANNAATAPVYTSFYSAGYEATLFAYNLSGNVCNGGPAMTGGPIPSSQLPRMRFGWYSAPDKDFEYYWEGDVLAPGADSRIVHTRISRTSRIIAYAEGRNGCVARDTLYVYVPDHDYEAHNDTTICEGASVRLYIRDHAPDQPGFSARWYEHDYQAPVTLSCNDCITPVALPQEDMRYTVVVTDSFGCADTLYTRVRVDLTAQVSILNNDTTIGYGMPLQLRATGTENYVWSPARWLSNAFVADPVARPEAAVTFVVTGMNGICLSYDSVRVSIDYRGNIFIPSAFSPDGDGLNDVFRVGNLTFQKLIEFRVFNRWGQEVFSTTDSKAGWDGRWKSELQPMGVYHYLIQVVFPEGEIKMYKGDVTLIR